MKWCEYIARSVRACKERTKMKKVILKSDIRGDVVKIIQRSDRDLKCYIQHSKMNKEKNMYLFIFQANTYKGTFEKKNQLYNIRCTRSFQSSATNIVGIIFEPKILSKNLSNCLTYSWILLACMKLERNMP